MFDAFMDLGKTYMVDRWAILQKLLIYGVSSALLNTIKVFIKHDVNQSG